MEKSEEIKTKNIKFCAYLRTLNINPNRIERQQYRGKAYYFYNMTLKDWDNLKIQFNKSDFIEYANCLEAIKDLAY